MDKINDLRKYFTEKRSAKSEEIIANGDPDDKWRNGHSNFIDNSYDNDIYLIGNSSFKLEGGAPKRAYINLKENLYEDTVIAITFFASNENFDNYNTIRTTFISNLGRTEVTTHWKDKSWGTSPYITENGGWVTVTYRVPIANCNKIEITNTLIDNNIHSPIYIDNIKKIKTPHGLLLSFDDGYRDNYTNAYPIMHEFKAPGVLYVATSLIGGRNENAGAIHDMCTMEELKELHDVGHWDIGSHTHNHVDITTLTAEQLHFEASESQKILLQNGIKYGPNHFCAPYWKTNTETEHILAQYYRSFRASAELLTYSSPSSNRGNFARYGGSGVTVNWENEIEKLKQAKEFGRIRTYCEHNVDTPERKEGLRRVLDFARNNDIPIFTPTELFEPIDKVVERYKDYGKF